MVKKTILVAGGTGNLGEKIIKALLKQKVNVRTIVRTNSSEKKIHKLEELGVDVIRLDITDEDEVTKASLGVSCIVSALQGLSDVIIDTQTILLNAAIVARVPRFIPSDYSLNFTRLPAGDNRNFDFRKEFHNRIDKTSISTTSIFNGTFANILTYNTPLLDLKEKSAGYWGENPDWCLDFTTMEDTAAFTAAVALDSSTPRYLNIASFQISPKELSEVATKLTGSQFILKSMGTLAEFSTYNNNQQLTQPETEKELYPRWQQGQYMHDMFTVHHKNLDNGLYPELQWTDGVKFIKTFI